MIYLLAATFLIITTYTILIVSFRRGWCRLPERTTSHKNSKRVFISVVVPFRNEESNLMQLIKNLSQQRFSFHYLEVIMVDDHSTDKGIETLKKLQESHHWLKVISSKGHGKKKALRNGISSATGELIVTTDADCRFGKDWLQTIAETYINLNPDMIVMPVKMEKTKASFASFQQTDYLALQMVTAGAIGAGTPIISSGANLAFKKKSFMESIRSIGGQNYLSGDDVFLLHAFKRHSFKIYYLKSAQSMVTTSPAPTLGKFLLQRMRWGGKSRGYKDQPAKFTALTIFATNSYLALLPFTVFFNFINLWIWGGALLIKTIVDSWLLNTGKQFFTIKLTPLNMVVFSLIYPFYILLTGIGSIVAKEYWKERKGK